MPGIGLRTSTAVENSKESGARMYMRANVEIFLKGTAGQDADGEWGRNVGVEVGETRKVLGKGCTLGSARFLGERNERER